MPAYNYTCSQCRNKETRITGIDDHFVVCEHCGNAMTRNVDTKSLLASYAPIQRAVSR